MSIGCAGRERFRHLFQPGREELLKELEREVEERWQALLARTQSA